MAPLSLCVAYVRALSMVGVRYTTMSPATFTQRLFLVWTAVITLAIGGKRALLLYVRNSVAPSLPRTVYARSWY